MANSIGERLMHAWNAFTGQSQYANTAHSLGTSSGFRPDRGRLGLVNERSIIAGIYTRLGIDVAGVELRHVKVDQNGRFQANVKSGLAECLSLEANIDQAARAFKQDAAMTLFEEGVIAIVPVDTTLNPSVSGGYDVKSLRVGTVTQWFPRHIRIRVYNDRTGNKEEILLPKQNVAVVENPFYAVMNEPNSTLQRLIRKLNLLDAVDEQSSSGKLDLIIQLPYIVKSAARKDQAEERRRNIEMQLKGSKYGIAYIDGTERVTQLNRPAENNLLAQITYLTELLYSQLGTTASVFDGSADEKTMINYHNRTVEPLVGAITDGMRRAFLTKTARAQGQSITYFRDPFKFMTALELAEVGDKFIRNQITTPNEFRPHLGLPPSEEPQANQLRNPNLNPANGSPEGPAAEPGGDTPDEA